MASLHVSISAETIFHIGSLPVTNSMLASLIISGLLIAFALAVRIQLTKTNKPTGIQNFAEWLIETFNSLLFSVTGDQKKSRRFFAPIVTFFLFILLNNWFGLFPGFGTIGVIHEKTTDSHGYVEEYAETAHTDETTEKTDTTEEEVAAKSEGTEEKSEGTFVPILRAGTADLNTTLALALISFSLIQFFGVQYVHLEYFKKFINFSSPINFYVGVLELISEFAKIISFAFRLFGNVFAGEVLLVVISALVPILIPMPFYGLEIFVGLVQALVFTMLSLVFFNMATEHH